MAGKNFHGIIRLNHREIKARVKDLIIKEKAISKLQICRVLNGQDIEFCKYALHCYANSRKRAHLGLIHYPDCLISFNQVRYALKKLVKEGLIWVKRQKWPDHFQPRGYDWMSICRPWGRGVNGRKGHLDKPPMGRTQEEIIWASEYKLSLGV